MLQEIWCDKPGKKNLICGFRGLPIFDKKYDAKWFSQAQSKIDKWEIVFGPINQINPKSITDWLDQKKFEKALNIIHDNVQRRRKDLLFLIAANHCFREIFISNYQMINECSSRDLARNFLG